MTENGAKIGTLFLDAYSLSLKFFGQSLFPYSYLVFKKADTLFKL